MNKELNEELRKRCIAFLLKHPMSYREMGKKIDISWYTLSTFLPGKCQLKPKHYFQLHQWINSVEHICTTHDHSIKEF